MISVAYGLSHDDIEIFQFRPLARIRKELKKTEIYSEKEIKDMITGLSELPEYAKTSPHEPERLPETG